MPNDEQHVVKNNALSWLALTAFIVMMDQVTKYLVVHYFVYGESVPVLPFLNITLRYNSGAAYSWLSQQGGWQLYFLPFVSSVVSIVLLVWLYRTPRQESWLAAGISLVIGGAVGNLIDRVLFQHVIDFIGFHLGDWHFAIFNIADSAVSVGAVIIIIRMLFPGKAQSK